MRNWSLNSVNGMSQVTQPVSDRAGIWSWECDSRALTLLQYVCGSLSVMLSLNYFQFFLGHMVRLIFPTRFGQWNVSRYGERHLWWNFQEPVITATFPLPSLGVVETQWKATLSLNSWGRWCGTDACPSAPQVTDGHVMWIRNNCGHF